MSVAQAVEFYGPVREILRTKLKDMIAAKAVAAIEKELGFKVPVPKNARWAIYSGRSLAKTSSRTLCDSWRDAAPASAIRHS